MKIFTKRNALIGFVTVKALERRRRRRKTMRLAAFITLGLVSAGILAAVLAIALRRHQSESDSAEQPAEKSTIEPEVMMPEPVPAT